MGARVGHLGPGSPGGAGGGARTFDCRDTRVCREVSFLTGSAGATYSPLKWPDRCALHGVVSVRVCAENMAVPMHVGLAADVLAHLLAHGWHAEGASGPT